MDPKSGYYDAGGIETWDFIKAKLTHEQAIGFCLGNILKYSSRMNYKGEPQRDREKIGYYSKLLDQLEDKNLVFPGPGEVIKLPSELTTTEYDDNLGITLGPMLTTEYDARVYAAIISLKDNLLAQVKLGDYSLIEMEEALRKFCHPSYIRNGPL